MKKKAFTLQEMLVTMAVIGVVAALALPALTNIRPDETKVKYMKAYNAITNITADILDDPALYFVTYDNTGQPACSGLDCYDMPPTEILDKTTNALLTKAKTAGAGDKAKYPVLFVSKLNTINDPVFSSTHTTFTTSDGISWDIESEKGGTKGKYGITINIKPNDNSASHNCTFSTSCSSPNKFTFDIDNDGGITATDKLGKAFLLNPTNMHSVDEDKVKAKTL